MTPEVDVATHAAGELIRLGIAGIFILTALVWCYLLWAAKEKQAEKHAEVMHELTKQNLAASLAFANEVAMYRASMERSTRHHDRREA